MRFLNNLTSFVNPLFYYASQHVPVKGKSLKKLIIYIPYTLVGCCDSTPRSTFPPLNQKLPTNRYGGSLLVFFLQNF
jgi:hypothetical protein